MLIVGQTVPQGVRDSSNDESAESGRDCRSVRCEIAGSSNFAFNRRFFTENTHHEQKNVIIHYAFQSIVHHAEHFVDEIEEA